jgi:hypothetical protein
MEEMDFKRFWFSREAKLGLPITTDLVARYPSVPYHPPRSSLIPKLGLGGFGYGYFSIMEINKASNTSEITLRKSIRPKCMEESVDEKALLYLAVNRSVGMNGRGSHLAANGQWESLN